MCRLIHNYHPAKSPREKIEKNSSSGELRRPISGWRVQHTEMYLMNLMTRTAIYWLGIPQAADCSVSVFGVSTVDYGKRPNHKPRVGPVRQR